MNHPPGPFGASFTPEQFERLLAVLPSIVQKGPGLGAPGKPSPKMFGLGCCGDMTTSGDGDGLGPLSAGVYTMLAGGSPRLALCKARGIPLAPQTINVRAVFPDTTTAIVPDVGSDEKITQDLIVDSMVARVQNLSLTANQNVFQSLSDFFFGFTSGIEATLSVTGAPRYSPVVKFTPLANIADVINGCCRWPGGWILTYQQQLKMDFQARIALPYAPIEVIVTFRTWQPVTQSFVVMTTREAISALQTEFGIELAQSYVDRMIAIN